MNILGYNRNAPTDGGRYVFIEYYIVLGYDLMCTSLSFSLLSILVLLSHLQLSFFSLYSLFFMDVSLQINNFHTLLYPSSVQWSWHCLYPEYWLHHHTLQVRQQIWLDDELSVFHPQISPVKGVQLSVILMILLFIYFSKWSYKWSS